MGRITEAVKHILIVNVLFFIATQLLGDQMYQWFSLWFPQNENFYLWQVVTHMFMHGGFMHILFNMYALWAFGTPMEQMWGRNKFVFFYFSAGLGAALIHILVNYYHFNSGLQVLLGHGFQPEEIYTVLNEGRYMTAWESILTPDDLDNFLSAFMTPSVGASGAIYGVLVAFGMMFPNAELMLLFFPIPVKAKYFIPGLIVVDLFSGLSGTSIFGPGIAHFAHLGGALFGFIMVWYWKRNQFRNNRWD